MKALFVGMVFLAAGTAEAWNCEHEKEVDQVLHLGGAQQLVIEAGAGELEISGDGKPGQVRVRGRVCVSQEDWLEQSELLVTEGARYAIRTELPELGDDCGASGRRPLRCQDGPASRPGMCCRRIR